MMIITGVGGSDFNADMFSTSEQVLSAVIILVGAMLWASVIATLCAFVADANSMQTEFHRTVDELNQLMSRYAFPQQVKIRLREYFHQTIHMQDHQSRLRLSAKMSPMFQAEVALRCSESFLRNVYFLRDVESEFLVQISLNLSARVFGPSEVITPGFLYFVRTGVVLYAMKVITVGGTWGEDMILRSPLLRRFAAVTITHLQAYRLSRETLMELAFFFPAARRRIRRCTMMLALRRYLVQVAQQTKRISKKSSLQKGMRTKALSAATQSQSMLRDTSMRKQALELMECYADHVAAGDGEPLLLAAAAEDGVGEPMATKAFAARAGEDFTLDAQVRQLREKQDEMRVQQDEMRADLRSLLTMQQVMLEKLDPLLQAAPGKATGSDIQLGLQAGSDEDKYPAMTSR